MSKPKKRKKKITPGQKNRAFAIWGFNCVYCGSFLYRSPTVFKTHSLDHLIPEAFDGSNAWQNLVPSCASCNWIKGNATDHYDLKAYPKDGKRKHHIEKIEERTKAIDSAHAAITRWKQKHAKEEFVGFREKVMKAAPGYKDCIGRSPRRGRP